MNSDTSFDREQILSKIRQAVGKGDYSEAELWAGIAAQEAKGGENAWLLLGDLAGDGSQIRCYTKALEVNPRSEAARQKLKRALAQQRRKRQREALQLSPKIRLSVPFGSTIQKKTSLRAVLTLFCLAAVLVLTAWTGFSTLGALVTHAASLSPTHTPQTLLAARVNVLTSTPTITPTPTLTPTLTPTPTPTPTKTPIPTNTAVPPTAAVVPQNGRQPGDIGANEFWIEVDLSDQRLIAYQGDEVLRTFVISSGKPSTPTVTGSFRVYIMLRSQTMVGPGYVQPDVPYVMYFFEDFSIHGTYWHSNFGIPVSHGCVNLPTADAAWVYQNAVIGTWVIIHN